MKNKETTYEEITVKILSKTKESLTETSKLSGASIGELIDRMTFNWYAKDSTTAGIMILQDMLTHTQKLNNEEVTKSFTFVINMIKQSLENDKQV